MNICVYGREDMNTYIFLVQKCKLHPLESELQDM